MPRQKATEDAGVSQAAIMADTTRTPGPPPQGAYKGAVSGPGFTVLPLAQARSQGPGRFPLAGMLRATGPKVPSRGVESLVGRPGRRATLSDVLGLTALTLRPEDLRPFACQRRLLGQPGTAMTTGGRLPLLV